MLASKTGTALVFLVLLGAVAAPVLAPHAIDDKFLDLPNAPPTLPRIIDRTGTVRLPFIYPWRLVSRLEARFEQDTATAVPLRWFSRGRVVESSDNAVMPLLLLGSDSYGHDVFSRLLFGARLSLALSIAAALGSVLVGGLAGAVSGYAGGWIDDVLMKTTDLVMVLPMMYVALALRAVLSPTVTQSTVFAFLTAIFAIIGAPFVSRGVRGIVRSERRLDYAVAAVSLGAGHGRLLWRHLIPATRGFLGVQITMLVPAFIVSEATLSYVGLGFTDPAASWGTMLHEASNLRAFADFPWLLSPAAAIFLFVLGLNLLIQGKPYSLVNKQ